MKKIICMLVLMLAVNVYAADRSSGDWSGSAPSTPRNGSRGSIDCSAFGDAPSATHDVDPLSVVAIAEDSSEYYPVEPTDPADPVALAESLVLSASSTSHDQYPVDWNMVLSDPMPRGMPTSFPKLTDSSYGRQLAAGTVTLAPIRVVSCLNRAHNPATITVPSMHPDVHPGMVSIFTVLGTKGIKGLQTKKIGLQIPVLSVGVSEYDADYAAKTLWTIFKGHNAERHIIHYSPQGVFTYMLTPEGKFTTKTMLALASDVARDLVLVIDHGKLPGIALISEKELSVPAKKRSTQKLLSMKSHK